VNVSLYVTHACNLRCDYCFNGHDLRRAMAPEVAEQALTLLFAPDRDDAGTRMLTFFGGEPLLEVPLVRHLVPLARRSAEEVGRGLELALVTNGTLLDEATVAFLAEEQFRVAISIDGVAAAHDACRRTAGGGGSHGATVAGIRLLQEKAPHLRLRAFSTLHPTTVAHLADSFEYLLDLGLWDLAFNLDMHAPWPERDRDAYRAALHELGDRYIAAFRQGRRVALNLLDSKIVTHLTGRAFGTRRCNFGCEEVFVAASGRLYPCDRMVGQDDRDDRVIGDVWSGVDVARRDELVTAKNRAGDACGDCEFAHRCVHWCGCVNDILTGWVGTVDGLWCWFEQRLIEEADRCASILVAEQNEAFQERFYGGTWPGGG